MTDASSTDHLIGECRRIEEDSTYTAETHHVLRARDETWGKALKAIPAVAAAAAGTAAVAAHPIIAAACALVAAVVGALFAVLDPDRAAREHLVAAKGFTSLKHDARFLADVMRFELAREQLAASVQRLRERYNQIAEHAPPTTDRAFERARQKVRAGRHAPDAVSSVRTIADEPRVGP